MAQSLVAAESLYVQAVTGLSAACALLLHHVPQVNTGVVLLGPPSLWPEQRVASDLAPSQLKADTYDHSTSVGIGQYNQQYGTQSRTKSYAGRNLSFWDRKNQVTRTDAIEYPKTDLICEDIKRLDEKFEMFTSALATICLFVGLREASSYENHLLCWTNYYAWIKDSADSFINSGGQPIQGDGESLPGRNSLQLDWSEPCKEGRPMQHSEIRSGESFKNNA